MDKKTQNQIKGFFKDNQNLFKKPANLRINHADIFKEMQKHREFHWTWGKCFPMAQFVFYYLGGYSGNWDLKCIAQIPYKVADIEALTSHWFVQHKETGEIIDLSRDQFEGILNIDERYHDGRRCNIGFPYYNVGGSKIHVNGTAPTKQVLKFYEAYRNIEIVEHLEYHLNASKGIIEDFSKNTTKLF